HSLVAHWQPLRPPRWSYSKLRPKPRAPAVSAASRGRSVARRRQPAIAPLPGPSDAGTIVPDRSSFASRKTPARLGARDSLLEVIAGTAQARRHRADRDLAQLGDLLGRQLFQFEQHEHHAQLLRHLVQQAIEQGARLTALQQLFAVEFERRLFLCGLEGLLPPSAQATPSSRADVQRHAVQECALASGFDSAQAPRRGQEDALSRVIGIALADAESSQQPPDVRVVLAHELGHPFRGYRGGRLGFVHDHCLGCHAELSPARVAADHQKRTPVAIPPQPVTGGTSYAIWCGFSNVNW